MFRYSGTYVTIDFRLTNVKNMGKSWETPKLIDFMNIPKIVRFYVCAWRGAAAGEVRRYWSPSSRLLSGSSPLLAAAVKRLGCRRRQCVHCSLGFQTKARRSVASDFGGAAAGATFFLLLWLGSTGISLLALAQLFGYSCSTKRASLR